MLDLNDIRLFVRAVDCGGFAAAGRKLGVAKSSLSQRIAKLEREVGARLIQRTSRSFAITQAGRDFYRHAVAMLMEAEAAEAAVKQQLGHPLGAVRLSSSAGTLHAGLAALLARFSMEYPQVLVQHHATNRTVDLIAEGFDLAVRAHGADMPDSGLVQRRLGFSPRWLVASPVYLRAAGVPARPSDLAHHQALCMANGDWSLEDDAGGRERAPMQRRLCIDDPQALLIAAQEGLGVASLPAGLCRAVVRDGGLTRVLPGWREGGATISLLTPHRDGRLPSVQALTDYLAQRLPDAMGLEA